MRHVFVIAALAIVACDGGTDPGPIDTIAGPLRFNAVLGTVKCQTEMGLTSAPCLTQGGAGTSYFVDSGRVVFSTDRTVQWILGTHSRVCTQGTGNCTIYDNVSVRTGTYTAIGDSVVIVFSMGTPATRTLKRMGGVKFPASETGWAGPDSLVCTGGGDCGSFYTAVFLKSP